MWTHPKRELVRWTSRQFEGFALCQPHFSQVENADGGGFEGRQVSERVLLDDNPFDADFKRRFDRRHDRHDARADGGEVAALV